MKKLFRILLFTGLFFVGLLIIVGIVLKVYLSEERLRTLLLPPMREALGREVEVASLKIDLFSGIKVAGLVVKEADGKADFVAVKEFGLGYSLWPLLEKRLEITRVRIDRPVVKVWRNQDGLYNFSDLKILQAAEKPAAGESNKQSAQPNETSADKLSPSALPLALVVQSCEITDASLSFYDEMGELPKVDIKADLKSRLDLGDLKPESINGEGSLNFSLTAEYQSLTPQVQGKIEFDRQKMVYRVLVKQANEECTVSGSVSDYLAAKPAIILNLDSPRLDLAYLAALGQKLSASGSAGGEQTPANSGASVKPDQTSTSAPGLPSPPSLTARGAVNIKQAVYENYKVDNFTLSYQYQDALLTISDLKGDVADGSIAAAATIKPFLSQPDFQGNFSFADLQMSALMAMAKPALKDNLSGAGHGQFKFSGRGVEAAALKKSLSLEGEYGLRQAGLDNLPLTKSLSQLLGLPELENLKVTDLVGNLQLKDGQVNLNNSWNGDQLSGRAVGEVGLDGSLDMPLHLVLSQQLSAKMAQRYPWVKETFNDKQEVAVGLSLAGTLSKPRLRLDEKKVQELLQKKLLEKLGEKLFGKDGESGSEGTVRPEDLLRQFLKK
ncbi:MAG: hypothetical protein J7L57_05745 [Deltaproteobacteria bacterium]|nr:hypothetical protein [Candidatus Tharpella sp.]